MTGPADLGRSRLRDWHLTWGRRSWTVRSWLVLLILLGLAVGYGLGWGTFVKLNTEDIYHQLPSAATAEWDGATFRVEELRRQALLDESDPDGGGEPLPGSVWVTAVVQVTGPDLDDVLGHCELDLLGPDGRTWEPTYAYDDLVRDCSGVEGESATVHLTYQVPEEFVGQLYGLVVQSHTVHRQVITP